MCVHQREPKNIWEVVCALNDADNKCIPMQSVRPLAGETCGDLLWSQVSQLGGFKNIGNWVDCHVGKEVIEDYLRVSIQSEGAANKLPAALL